MPSQLTPKNNRIFCITIYDSEFAIKNNFTARILVSGGITGKFYSIEEEVISFLYVENESAFRDRLGGSASPRLEGHLGKLQGGISHEERYRKLSLSIEKYSTSV